MKYTDMAASSIQKDRHLTVKLSRLTSAIDLLLRDPSEREKRDKLNTTLIYVVLGS